MLCGLLFIVFVLDFNESSIGLCPFCSVLRHVGLEFHRSSGNGAHLRKCVHLSGRLDLLDEKQFKSVQDGIKVYNELSPIKHSALPYFPDGFTQFGAKGAASGLKYGNKIYLAVWNLDNADIKDISFKSNISDAKIIYPKEAEADFCAEENKLKIKFKSEKTALFFAIELK